MSHPLDEKRLGELLVTTGKLSSEELLAALEEQRQYGGPQGKPLADILVKRGHLSFGEMETALQKPATKLLWCPRCCKQARVQLAFPGSRHVCPGCHGDLQDAMPAAETKVLEPETPMRAPDESAEALPDDVRQAMADPSRQVGKYILLSVLGQGGMGRVYRAYDPQLRRHVAIKMITNDRAADQEGFARFMREAQACARLHHPSIVAVHEVGEHGGLPYLVMDLVEGNTLTDHVTSESPSIRELIVIIHDIALALDHAHTVGIVHRDVKPDNIMVSSQGRPLLMDFGLARETSAQQQLTQTGQVLGTPLYMAPEQIKGDGIGPWTDIYALGGVLYRVLTGNPPFISSNTIALFRAIIMDQPHAPGDQNAAVSQDIDTLTLKCLEKEPDQRYPSAAAVADELQLYLAGHPILARPLGPRERAIRWARRNRALSTAILVCSLVIAMVVLGAAGIVMHQASRAKSEAQAIRQEAARETSRREKAARVLAEQQSMVREKEITRLEQERLRQERIETRRQKVTEILDSVRTGEALEDPTDFRIKKSTLLNHRASETVQLLITELDELSSHLARHHHMSADQELFLRFLCETLAELRIPQGSVSSLGRYLQTELALPGPKRNQLRAVPAGKALCILGGEEADRLLIEARGGFDINGSFWGQVKRLYGRTGGAEPALGSETVDEYLNRGLRRYSKGDLSGAIADYTRAIEIDPSDIGLWVARGAAHDEKGDFDDAIADATRALEIDPKHAGALFNRGNARWKNGDLDGAIGDYTHAIEIDPNYTGAWQNRGSVRTTKGDHAGALADLTRAIEIDPTNAHAMSNRGFLRGFIGDLKGAISDHTRALEIDSSIAAWWTGRGNARMDTGDLDGAIADFTRALELSPSDPTTWTSRGLAQSNKGELDSAIADYSRAIKIDPNISKTWKGRGVALWRKGNVDAAIADYSRAMEISPNDPEVWFNRGTARKHKGLLDESIADLTRALELNPRHAMAWGNRANARQAQGDIDGAIADFTQAILVNPKVSGFWSNRGGARQIKGDLDGAIADCNRAIDIDPSVADLWGQRGIARRAKGDIDGAIDDWQRFLDLAPNHSQAPTVHATLQKLRAQQAKAGAGAGK